MPEDNQTTTTTTEVTTTSVPVVKPAEPPVNMVPQNVVDRVTGEKWEAIRAREDAERRAALAEAALAEAKKITTSATTTTSEPPPAAKPLSPEELRKLVNEQSAVNDFNKACNASVEEGRKTHNDFDKIVLQDLVRLSPVYDPRAGGPILPQTLVEAALETGEAHEVLYALGKDAAAAERIMRLPPIKQAVEIAKFHDKLVAARGDTEDDNDTGDSGDSGDDADAGVDSSSEVERASAPARTAVPRTPPNTSRAPAPIKSRTGASGTRPAFDIMDTSKSSTADWIRQREAQLRKDRENGITRR